MEKIISENIKIEPVYLETDNPDVVIERTITNKEININGISLRIEALNALISDYNEKIKKLELLSLPEIVKEIVDKEIGKMEGEKYSYEQEIIRLNKIIA